jgi:hypothetical protein
MMWIAAAPIALVLVLALFAPMLSAMNHSPAASSHDTGVGVKVSSIKSETITNVKCTGDYNDFNPEITCVGIVTGIYPFYSVPYGILSVTISSINSNEYYQCITECQCLYFLEDSTTIALFCFYPCEDALVWTVCAHYYGSPCDYPSSFLGYDG